MVTRSALEMTSRILLPSTYSTTYLSTYSVQEVLVVDIISPEKESIAPAALNTLLLPYLRAPSFTRSPAIASYRSVMPI